MDVLQRPCCGTRTEVFTTGGFYGLVGTTQRILPKMKKEGVESFISSCIQKWTLFDLVSETNIRVAHGAMSHLAGMAGLDLGNAKMWRTQKTGGPRKLATRTGQQRGPMIFFKHFDTLIRTSKKNVT